MQTKTAVIRVQTLDGLWETIGVDRLRGVYPENDSYTSDEWGSAKCSFDLHREPGSAFPDLGAFTPIEVEIGGVLVWSGFVGETPVREGDRIFNVQGKGWQFHLDDDQYRRPYVHAKLSEYKDLRTFPACPLTTYLAAPQVSADRGVVLLSFPANVAVANTSAAGVLLDLGDSVGKTVFATFDTQTARGNLAVEIITGDTVDTLSTLVQDLSFPTGTGRTLGPTTSSSTFRYVGIRLISLAGGAFTDPTDTWARVTAIKVFSDAAYQTAGASILKATDVIPDALERATILLSDDRSLIDPDNTVTFAFPEFAMGKSVTPREAWDAVDAVHGYRKMIDVYRRAVYGPKPSRPRIEIGAWPGSEFDDASANDGDEIYNRVLVEGNGAAGEPITVERTAGQQAGVPIDVISSPSPDNPSFTTNTANWTASSGTTITRDVAKFDTTPASGHWERGGGAVLPGDSLVATFSGTFVAGITYVLTLRFSGHAGIGVNGRLRAQWGVASDQATTVAATQGVTWMPLALSWTPSANQTGVTLTLAVTDNAGTLVIWHPWIDSLVLAAAKPTLVDRRAFRRTQALPIKASLTPELGSQIGDVWLAAHKTTPLKGTVKITGDKATREILTGASVPPERLLTMTGELLRISHRVDPDYAAGQGRDGRIAEVTYAPPTDSATVALDARRTSHEALLERLAVVIGSG